MPFAPMWTAVLLKLVTSGISRISNANVESFFNIVKHNILNSETNLKAGRFVKKFKKN